MWHASTIVLFVLTAGFISVVIWLMWGVAWCMGLCPRFPEGKVVLIPVALGLAISAYLSNTLESQFRSYHPVVQQWQESPTAHLLTMFTHDSGVVELWEMKTDGRLVSGEQEVSLDGATVLKDGIRTADGRIFKYRPE